MATKKKKQRSTEKLDIKNHILVPKHEKCSEAEKKRVLEKYNSELKDFPKIAVNDSALYELDVKIGDMIKISRDSPTAGKSIFYRVVIEF